MQRVRITATPAEGFGPPLFDVLADPPAGESTRLLDWNLGDGSRPTALLETDAAPSTVRAAVAESPAVVSADVHQPEDGPTYCFLTLSPDPGSAMAQLFEMVSREGLVVVKPIVYRDGSVHATWVGDAETLQGAIDAMPAAVDVEIDAVGGMGGGSGSILDGLSARQREALEVALEIGYYDRPRTATHEDVAAALGCAPSTASEHLLKAEATVIRAALSRFG